MTVVGAQSTGRVGEAWETGQSEALVRGGREHVHNVDILHNEYMVSFPTYQGARRSQSWRMRSAVREAPVL